MTIDRRTTLRRVITMHRETLTHLEHELEATENREERKQLRARQSEVLNQLRATQRELDDYVTSLNADAVGKAERGDYDQARQLYEEVAATCREENDLRGESAAYRTIGMLYQTENRYTEAVSYLQKALELAQSAGDRVQEGYALAQLAFTYHRDGKIDEAEQLYPGAIERLREAGDKHALAEALWNFGWLYRYDRWDNTRALHLWEEAVPLMFECGYPGVQDYWQNLTQFREIAGT